MIVYEYKFQICILQTQVQKTGFSHAQFLFVGGASAIFVSCVCAVVCVCVFLISHNSQCFMNCTCNFFSIIKYDCINLMFQWRNEHFSSYHIILILQLSVVRACVRAGGHRKPFDHWFILLYIKK